MAFYAAKKPSRFGIVKIDFIEIPRSDKSKVHEWLNFESKNITSLNVGGILKTQTCLVFCRLLNHKTGPYSFNELQSNHISACLLNALNLKRAQ